MNTLKYNKTAINDVMRKIYHIAMLPHRNTIQTHHKTTKFYKNNGKSGSHFICCFSPKQTTKLSQWYFFFFFFSSLDFIMNWHSFALISCCFAVRFATVPWHLWATLSFSLRIRELEVVTFQGTHTSVCCSKGELCYPLDLSPSNGYCNWFPSYLSTGQWFIWWRALSNVWATKVNNNRALFDWVS